MAEKKASLVNDDKNTHIMMVENDHIIGYAHFHFGLKDKPTIVFFHIDKEKRSIGFGAKFLAAIEKWLESNKHNLLYVASVPSMLKFYKKKRYLECSDLSLCVSIDENSDAVILGKKLANKRNNNIIGATKIYLRDQ